jgi:L-lactate dehydrogenase (cytochrome)
MGRHRVGRNRWGGKLILKGIQDAQLAVNTGADAIIVSTTAAGRRALPPSRPACHRRRGGQPDRVHMDGSIRSGQDVLKAVALGAKAPYIGRSMLALGAMAKA